MPHTELAVKFVSAAARAARSRPTATDRLRRRSPRGSPSSVLLPRRATPLADGLQIVRRHRLRIAASRGAAAEARNRF